MVWIIRTNKNTIQVVEGECRRQAAHRADQTYLGTAEGIAWLVQVCCSFAATTGEFGLPGALWLAAEN